MPPHELIRELHADLLAAEQNRPRSQQVETGASQALGCRAEAMFRLRGTPETDPRLSWEAYVGSAVHDRLDQARADDARYITETRFHYRGVPCTVDLLIDTATKTLCDYKTRNSPADFPNEPKASWLAQVNLGAMAAREAGIDVAQVAIICLPRSGGFEPELFGPYPVDPTVADQAADRVAEMDELAASDADPRDYRDERPAFCRSYCGFVTTCRGEPQPEQPLDESIAADAAEYDAARVERDKAQARMSEAREVLLGLSGRAGDWSITTTGGRDKTDHVEDTEQLRDLWRWLYDTEPPTREQAKTTPTRLTVKRADQ